MSVWLIWSTRFEKQSTADTAVAIYCNVQFGWKKKKNSVCKLGTPLQSSHRECLISDWVLFYILKRWKFFFEEKKKKIGLGDD